MALHIPTPATAEIRAGVAYAAAAYTMWGLIPLYWRLLAHVPPLELTLHRIFWCALVVGLLLLAGRRFGGVVAVLRDRRTLGTLVLTSLLISINWGLYIWCVATGQLVEASLGYYINPLVSIALGIVLLGERVTRLRLAAIVLAALAVLVQSLSLDHVPWIALTLAVSFGLYGYFRKTAMVGALEGLFVEAALLAPAIAAVLGSWMAAGTGAFAAVDARTDLLLVLAGPLTALPLALFAAGARRVSLATLGFLQYLSPSLTLLLAVGLFGEPFTAVHAATFALIWLALALISLESLRRERA